jgi:hypothetical protein
MFVGCGLLINVLKNFTKMHDFVLPHPAPCPQWFELGNYLYVYGVCLLPPYT